MTLTKTTLCAAAVGAAALLPLACREPIPMTAATAAKAATVTAVAVSSAAAPPASGAAAAAMVAEVGVPLEADWRSETDRVARSIPRRPGQWIARRPNTPGLQPNGFVVLSPPSAEHPQGTIAAMAYPLDSYTNTALVIIDVATGKELRRTPLGGFAPDYITLLPGAIVLGARAKDSLDLSYYDLEGGPLGVSRSIDLTSDPQDQRQDRGLVAFDDRLIVATGQLTTTLRLLDEKGNLLSKFQCPGHPGAYPVHYDRIGDELFTANTINDDFDHPTVCAFYLHGALRSRHVILRAEGATWTDGTKLYYRPTPSGPTRVMTPDLRLGPVVDVPEPDREPRTCWGAAGDDTEHAAVSGETLVIDRVSCCGPDGGGLYFCTPPPEGDAGGHRHVYGEEYENTP